MLTVQYKYNNLPKLTAAALLLTNDCNFGCEYCYEKNGFRGHCKNQEMTPQIAKRSVDFLFENAKLTKDRVAITLFGGEPTLNYDAMKTVFEICEYNRQITNIDYDIGMITNGSIMNDKLYNLLDKYKDISKLHIQLSVDGPKKIQDLSRRLKNGKSSFKLVEKNIPIWKKLFEGKERGLNIHGVLNRDTIKNLYESYLFFREEWQIPHIWFLPAKDDRYTEYDVEMYSDQLYKIKDYIMEKVRESKSLKEIEMYAPIDKSLLCGQNRKNKKLCGAGVNYCGITYNGEIYPCHHLYFIDDIGDYKIGDIFRGVHPLECLSFTEYDGLKDIRGCETCSHQSVCYRCLAENIEFYEAPFTQFKFDFCKMMKVDETVQNEIYKEILDMGLIGNSCTSTTVGNNTSCQCKGVACPQYNNDCSCQGIDQCPQNFESTSDYKEDIKNNKMNKFSDCHKVEYYFKDNSDQISQHDVEFKKYVMDALTYLLEKKGDNQENVNKS